MLGSNALIVIPAILGTAVALVFGLPLLCAFVLAGRISREEERAPLHEHVCSRCRRVQKWTQPFDQFSPCRACQSAMGSSLEIDLEHFQNADEVRRHLEAAWAPGPSTPSSDLQGAAQ